MNAAVPRDLGELFPGEEFRVADVTGNTEEWLQWRKDRALTTCFASNAAAVLDQGKFKPRNRRELYLAKHGLLNHEPYHRGVAHGHKYEPVARALAESIAGEPFFPQTRISACERFVASPDGSTLDDRILLEVKCPSSGTRGELWDFALVGEVPPYYYWQCCQQAALSVCEELWFLVYAGPGANEQRLIKLDGEALRKDWHNVLRPAIIEFLGDLQEPPASDDCTDEALLETAAALEAIDAELEVIAAKRDELAEEFKARAAALGLAPGKPVKACGYTASFITRAGNVDWKRLSKDKGIPESVVESYRGAPTEYVALNKARKKK